MELKFIRDRQRAGIDAAKERGIYKGRQKHVDDAEICRLSAQGVPKAKWTCHVFVPHRLLVQAP